MNKARWKTPLAGVLALFISRTLLLLAIVIPCGLSWAGYPPTVPVFQPYQVTSPDGTWVLDVKPGNHLAAGPATTTLTNTKTGEIAWKRMLPYTFWQCCVNNEGIVAGYAYTKGALGENNENKDAGDFIVSFLDHNGEQIHEEITHRPPSSIGMGYYVPDHWVYRLIYDAGNDRMILLMPDGLFRCYHLFNATLTSAFKPEDKGDASAYGTPDEIRFIPGTRLILLQSNSAWGSSNETTSTSCVQLVDDGGRTIWAASKHRTYGADKVGPFPEFRIIDVPPPEVLTGDAGPFAGGDPFAEPDPFATPDEQLEVAGPPAPSTVSSFQIYFGDTCEKATFQLLNWSRSDNSPIYQVFESSREKSPLPKQSTDYEEPTPPTDFPALAARKVASFQLKRADGSSLTDISSVTLGPGNRIYAVDKERHLIQIFDRDGKFLHVCDAGEEHIIDSSYHDSTIAVDYEGNLFTRIADVVWSTDEKKKDPLAGQFLHFAPDGTLQEKPLASLPSGLSGNIAAQPITNNLIFYDHSSEVAVNNQDTYGSCAATITRRADGLWLENIEDVACAPDGTIAVRDSSLGNSSGGFTTPFPRLPNKLPTETINIYTKNGEPVRTLDFSRFAGLKTIAFDGKHIAATFPWDPPTPFVYLFDAAGIPVGAIRIEELAGKEQVNLRPFLISDGKEILAVDQDSGMIFRYAMP